MGFTTYGYRTESESAIDNEVPLYFSGAFKSAVSRVAPGAAEGGLDVYADELIQEHAGGKIMRFGFGTVASPTWVLDITSDGVGLTNPALTNPTLTNWRDTGNLAHDIRSSAYAGGASTAGAAIVAATATATIGAGAVTGFNVTSGGAYYCTPPTVTVIAASGDPGSGATGTAVLGSAGLAGVYLRARGTGFSSAPTVVFSGGGGSGAAATCTIDGSGRLATITLTNAGSGYTSPPTVSFSGGGGSGATATAVLLGRQVASITLGAGGAGYALTPTVALGGVWYQSPTQTAQNAAAITAAVTAAAGGGTSREVRVSGSVYVVDPMGLVNLSNHVHLKAASGEAVRLVPSVACHGVVWIDTTGSGGLHITDIGLGDTANPSTPTVGLLIANSESSGNASNVHWFQGVRMSGSYSVAPFYSPHYNSSGMINCSFANAYTGGEATTFKLTRNNIDDIHSHWTVISTTLAGVSDITCFRCEFHGDTGASTTNSAIYLENTAGIRFIGATVSASSTTAKGIVVLDVRDQPDFPYGWLTQTVFLGGGLYTETGSPVSTNAIYIYNPDGTGIVEDLRLESIGATVTNALIKPEATTTIKQLNVSGFMPNGGMTKLIEPVANPIVVEYPKVNCAGLDFSVGVSGAITGGDVLNHGTLTYGTCTARTEAASGHTTTFRGALVAGAGLNVTGAMAATGNVSGVNGTFSGPVSGTTGTFSGAVSGTTGSFSGGVSGTTGTFSSTVSGSQVTATTALRAGASLWANTGSVRLSSGGSVKVRNSTNASDITFLEHDPSTDSLQIGATSGLGLLRIYSQNGHCFQTGGYFEFGSGALATNATTGFLAIPMQPGTPTGSPGPTSGLGLLSIDSLNHILYFWDGAWRPA